MKPLARTSINVPHLALLLLAALLLGSCANRDRGGSATLGEYDGAYDPATAGYDPYSNPNGGGYAEDIPLTGRTEGTNFYASNVNRNLFPPVYFGFDEYSIPQSEFPKVRQIADHLRTNPAKLIIAGHTDASGTSEYNRNLGELRALSIRESLAQLGVASDRIQTVSYGEDYPANPSDDGANRRTEFGFHR